MDAFKLFRDLLKKKKKLYFAVAKTNMKMRNTIKNLKCITKIQCGFLEDYFALERV